MCSGKLVWFLVMVNVTAAEILPSILWSPDNPIFKQFVNKTRKVMPMDKISFVCPNLIEYPIKRDNTYSKDKLYENIYMVDKEGYDSCNATGVSIPIIKCDQPFSLKHSTIVFQSMSAAQGDPEFTPGKEYYFIGTASGDKDSLDNKKGGHCSTKGMKMKVYVCGDKSDPKCPGGNEVVDGLWSPWGSCKDGHQSRECNNPAPDNGGLPCCGESSRPCTPFTDLATVSSTTFNPNDDPSKANRTGGSPDTASNSSLSTSTTIVVCVVIFCTGLCVGGAVVMLFYRRLLRRLSLHQQPVTHGSLQDILQTEASSRPTSTFSTTSESTQMVRAP